MIETFNTTFSEKLLEPFDMDDLIAMFKKMGEPQGLVMLPNGTGFDVYQFPVVLLKGAISIMHGRWERESKIKETINGI